MPRIHPVMCLLAAGIFASCTSFDKRWDATSAPVAPNPAAPMAGKWQGTWQSDATDYGGQLKAIIVPTVLTTKGKEPVQQYQAEFQFHFFDAPYTSYTITLNSTRMPDGRFHLEGKKDVGFHNGGIMTYDGYIDPAKDLFYCDYMSDKDAGTFKMRRILLEYQ
jgi:hypothetical protein